MFSEAREDLMSLLVVQSQIVLSVDAQIVHVNLEPLLCDHVSEDMIHKHLKHQWGIVETKKHDGGFKETKGGDECGFPLILFTNANIVISPSDVKLGEKSGVLHVVC